MTKRLTAVLLAMAIGACGSADDGADDGGGDLTVSAASSLADAFPAYAESLDGAVRFQFAGSNELAAQIRQGAKPDVLAAANMSLPEQLHADGLVGRPVRFATNQLVIAVPRDSRIRSLADLSSAGTTIAIGAADVPVGAYTRDVLARLGPARADAILANVRSEEPDVKGIVGKLAQGAVDAGFIYVTDVQAAEARLRAITLPVRLRPQIVYEAAVVTGAPHPERARAFIAGLLSAEVQTALKEAGFGMPPGR